MINGCGVIVRKDGKYLIGKRSDGQGWCSGGGHIEQGETPKQAARRELKEEFDIDFFRLKELGVIKGNEYETHVFLCDDPIGEPRADKDEIEKAIWVKPEELISYHLFEPFERSIKLLESEVK